MAAPLLFRAIPLRSLRLHLHHHHHRRLAAPIFAPTRRPCCSAAEPSRSEENLSSADNTTAAAWKARDSQSSNYHHRWDDDEYRKWKDKEDEILSDIEPISSLTKQILHSNRYLDGERLTAEDEKAVVEKLLAYHPHSEDKIGCGLDSIMVDRHPQFKRSRCLFVVRTDGGWIDFSYQKCLRAYIRDKYPSHAERFIKEHFKRGSG
ncbi:protein DCL homolog, chloroplastic [Castanea sativa]|uniref:protein DCL homolog, chloroplastic n=1 Tax=Castanea sativa TaxID=21020 RepID=UPI003F6549C4